VDAVRVNTISAEADSAPRSPTVSSPPISGLPRVVNGIVDVGAVEVQWALSAPARITGARVLGDRTFQLSFSNITGASFQVLATTNVALPTSNWPTIGAAAERPSGSGRFLFTDPEATNLSQRFYRVKSP